MKLLRWVLFVSLNIAALYLIDFGLIKLISFLLGWTIKSTFAWIVFILCILVFVFPLVYFLLSLIVSPLYYLCPNKRIGVVFIKIITLLDSILSIVLTWGVTIGEYEFTDNYKIVASIIFIIKAVMIFKLANKIHLDFKLNSEEDGYNLYKNDL